MKLIFRNILIVVPAFFVFTIGAQSIDRINHVASNTNVPVYDRPNGSIIHYMDPIDLVDRPIEDERQGFSRIGGFYDVIWVKSNILSTTASRSGANGLNSSSPNTTGTQGLN